MGQMAIKGVRKIADSSPKLYIPSTFPKLAPLSNFYQNKNGGNNSG